MRVIAKGVALKQSHGKQGTTYNDRLGAVFAIAAVRFFSVALCVISRLRVQLAFLMAMRSEIVMKR